MFLSSFLFRGSDSKNNDVFSRIRVLLDDSLKLDLVCGILLRFKY